MPATTRRLLSDREHLRHAVGMQGRLSGQIGRLSYAQPCMSRLRLLAFKIAPLALVVGVRVVVRTRSSWLAVTCAPPNPNQFEGAEQLVPKYNVKST